MTVSSPSTFFNLFAPTGSLRKKEDRNEDGKGVYTARFPQTSIRISVEDRLKTGALSNSVKTTVKE